MDIIAVRASSLPELFDCPARWEAKHLNKLRMPSSSNAALGKAVHAGTALFDASKIQGTPVTVDDAAGAVVDAIHNPDEDTDWGEDKPQDAEKIALALHGLYCTKVAPRQNYIAVEAKCERLDIIDLGISLTGTVDRVRRTEEGYGIVDIKTGIRAVGADGKCNTKGHAAQLAVYELLASHSLGSIMTEPAQIVGLQVAKTSKGQRCATGEIRGGHELLVGDGQSPGILNHAAHIIKSGSFFGNPKSMMCEKKYCPVYAWCKWR